ncbi:hypothetical protein NIES2134_113650 [Thermostichus vulcanus NIES-2134]|nr:hypothetical protein NIES2134_113650 [Thermostichus vulcanus NIES-2134]
MSSSGILVIQPHTTTRNIDIAGSASDITHLALNPGEFGLTSGFNHVIIGREDGTGTVTISSPITRNQHLSLRGGNIQLNSSITLGTTTSPRTLSLFSNGGSVTQSLPIKADGLILSGSGSFILNDASNKVNTIATYLSTGPTTYQNNGPLTVGTVSVPFVSPYPTCCTSSSTTLTATGITTSNADVILRTNGLLTLAASSNLGSGNLTLISQGGVDQGPSGSISAGGLGLQGNGTFNLNNPANDVDTFAANVDGGVTFQDSDDLTVAATVTSTVDGDIATTTGGLTTNGNDAILRTNGLLTLAASSNLGSGNLTLISQGGVDQGPSGSISAGGLGLQGNGTFNLNNPANDVDTFAANVDGGVTFQDSDDLTVAATVTSTVDGDIATTTGGLTTNGNDAILRTNGLLTLAASSNLGSGNLTLISQGGVDQGPSGSISAGGLGLQGNGTFNLNNAPIVVTVFAANINGNLLFDNLNSVTIGTVTSTVGSDSVTTTGINASNLPSGGNQPPSSSNLPSGGNQLPSSGAVISETASETNGSAIVTQAAGSTTCSRNGEELTEENREGKSRRRVVLINGRQTAVDPLSHLTEYEYEDEQWKEDAGCINLELNGNNVQ